MFKQQNEVDCGIFVLLGVEQLHQHIVMTEEESMEAAKRKKARMIKLCNALWERKTSLENIGHSGHACMSFSSRLGREP